MFIDPWGYKGLSLDLFGGAIKDWGCDCIFFFNYLRVNMALNNPYFIEHMNALFGQERADALRGQIAGLSPSEREVAVTAAISEALKEAGATHTISFCFKTGVGGRTSHYLVFASKSFRGYEIMKEIMAKESSDTKDGVPSFIYSPSAIAQPALFGMTDMLAKLQDMLLTDLAGSTLTTRQIYEQHSPGTPFLLKNYKDVLRSMESAGVIQVNPPASERIVRKGVVTFADQVQVTFPERQTRDGG
jgi:hypothetical protein